MSRIGSTLNAAVAMALSAVASFGGTAPNTFTLTNLSPYSSLFGPNRMTYGRKGVGISAAPQKRASRKARNRARNKAHH